MEERTCTSGKLLGQLRTAWSGGHTGQINQQATARQSRCEMTRAFTRVVAVSEANGVGRAGVGGLDRR